MCRSERRTEERVSGFWIDVCRVGRPGRRRSLQYVVLSTVLYVEEVLSLFRVEERPRQKVLYVERVPGTL